MHNRKLQIIFFILVVVIFFASINVRNIGKLLYPMQYSDSIYKYSNKYNLDPCFVAAIIKTESNFDAKAKSSKGAYGLMQITSSTGEWAADQMGIEGFNTNKLYDPEFNINMGCWYLDDLRKEFNNLELVTAAYNGGRGNVRKWLSSIEHSKDGKKLHYIPYEETDKYVRKVNVNYRIYKWIYGNVK